jgi:histidine triad (HIT) family protein
MADTIFGKIISGHIPCHRVYEDDRVLAFLDINPLSVGHTLVVPKEPAVTGTRDYNVLENNGAPAHQAIAHVHFHIIPKPNGQEGLVVGWPAGALDPARGQELAEKIRAALLHIGK